MMKFVTITSQGQITIPAIFRKQLGFNKYQKAAVSIKDDKLVIEPETDIMQLEGIIQDRAIKGKSIDQVIETEEKAMGEAIAEKYRRQLK